MIELSKRLATIASYIPEKKRVADIGGDHAWLLISLALSGKLRHGIVGELNQGPYNNAQQRVQAYGCTTLIDVRLGDGLTVCQADEIDVVVIAGMGGNLIRHILHTGQEKLANVERLVLQPNVASRAVRLWLRENKWHLVAETLVAEQGIIYEVMVAERGVDWSDVEGNHFSDLLMEIGPLLWKQRHPLLISRLQTERDKKKHVCNQLAHSQQSEAINKLEQLQQEIQEWERMIIWLSTERN